MSQIHFQELYCEQHSLTPEQYSRHLRSRALYPHARIFVPILTLFDSDYLAADNDFVDDVAQLKRYNDFFSASFQYIHHPVNRGFLRRRCRLRVSTERMRRIVRHTLKAQAIVSTQETMMPFPRDASETAKTSQNSPEKPV